MSCYSCVKQVLLRADQLFTAFSLQCVLDRIKIEPTSGIIESFGTQLIKVYLNADSVCMLSEIIDIDVGLGENW